MNKKYIALFFMIFLSSATQLRLGGAFGVSEIMGVLYLICVFNEKNLITRKYISDLTWTYEAILLLTIIILTSILAGAVINFFTVADLNERNAIDYVALLYAMLIGIVVFVDAENDIYVMDIIAFSAGLYISLMCFLLLLDSLGVEVPYIELWYAGEGLGDEGARFQGWSINPNQVGINLSGIIFLYPAILSSRRTNIDFRLLIMFFIEGLFIAYAIKSTTIGIIAAGMLIIFIYQHLKNNKNIMLTMILFVSLAVFGVLSGGDIFESKSLINENIVDKGTEGGMNGRFPLWRSSFEAIIDSPIFGYGPGAHSGFEGPHQKVESHSVFLDLGTQGGFVSILSYVAILIVSIGYGKNKTIKVFQFFPLIAVFIYQFSHYTLRYPIFWIMIFSPILFGVRNNKNE